MFYFQLVVGISHCKQKRIRLFSLFFLFFLLLYFKIFFIILCFVVLLLFCNHLFRLLLNFLFSFHLFPFVHIHPRSTIASIAGLLKTVRSVTINIEWCCWWLVVLLPPLSSFVYFVWWVRNMFTRCVLLSVVSILVLYWERVHTRELAMFSNNVAERTRFFLLLGWPENF